MNFQPTSRHVAQGWLEAFSVLSNWACRAGNVAQLRGQRKTGVWLSTWMVVSRLERVMELRIGLRGTRTLLDLRTQVESHYSIDSIREIDVSIGNIEVFKLF